MNIDTEILLQVCRLSTAGVDNTDRQIWARIIVGTAEAIPPLELVDTTGAGDGFIGGVMYGKDHQFSSFVVYSTGFESFKTLYTVFCYALRSSAVVLFKTSYSNLDYTGWIMVEQLG